MFSLFKIMLTINYQLMQLCMICLSVTKNVLNTTFGLVNRGRAFLRRMRFLAMAKTVLCRMRKSLIFALLFEVSIFFEKESFINAKKVLNFIQNLINEKKVAKFLTAFRIYPNEF